MAEAKALNAGLVGPELLKVPAGDKSDPEHRKSPRTAAKTVPGGAAKSSEMDRDAGGERRTEDVGVAKVELKRAPPKDEGPRAVAKANEDSKPKSNGM